MSNGTASLLRQQFKQSHDWLEGAMADVTSGAAQYQPQGKVNPIGAQYGHVLVSEDSFLSMVAGRQPVLATTHAGKTGLSEMPPDARDWTPWAHRVRVDLAAARDYAQAVYAATDAILAAMSDEDVNRPIDLSMVGMGMQTVAVALNIILLNNFSHTGEIACLKGLQGMQGYQE